MTIRPFNSDNFCVYKRWADYVKSHDLWIWNCADASHANEAKSGKYHWAYDPATKLIKSVGSETLRPDKPFCWFLSNPDRVYSQRVKIAPCDEADVKQHWTYTSDGRLVFGANEKLCVNYSAFGKMEDFGIFG